MVVDLVLVLVQPLSDVTKLVNRLLNFHQFHFGKLNFINVVDWLETGAVGHSLVVVIKILDLFLDKCLGLRLDLLGSLALEIEATSDNTHVVLALVVLASLREEHLNVLVASLLG